MTPRVIAAQPNYRAMAEFRYQIRKFLRFSEHAAREGGMEPQHYQLMLAIKGLPDNLRPRIGDIAERLQIQHHSTVELVDRLSRRGLVRRKRSDKDRREVLLELTSRGERELQEMAVHHRSAYRETAPMLVAALKRVLREPEASDGAGKKGKVARVRTRNA